MKFLAIALLAFSAATAHASKNENSFQCKGIDSKGGEVILAVGKDKALTLTKAGKVSSHYAMLSVEKSQAKISMDAIEQVNTTGVAGRLLLEAEAFPSNMEEVNLYTGELSIVPTSSLVQATLAEIINVNCAARAAE